MVDEMKLFTILDSQSPLHAMNFPLLHAACMYNKLPKTEIYQPTIMFALILVDSLKWAGTSSKM